MAVWQICSCYGSRLILAHGLTRRQVDLHYPHQGVCFIARQYCAPHVALPAGLQALCQLLTVMPFVWTQSVCTHSALG